MRYGAPIGREIGVLRGLAGALLGFLEKETLGFVSSLPRWVGILG